MNRYLRRSNSVEARELVRVAERAKVLQHTAERVGERRGARFHLRGGVDRLGLLCRHGRLLIFRLIVPRILLACCLHPHNTKNGSRRSAAKIWLSPAKTP